jgi:hypothetical protein
VWSVEAGDCVESGHRLGRRAVMKSEAGGCWSGLGWNGVVGRMLGLKEVGESVRGWTEAKLPNLS